MHWQGSYNCVQENMASNFSDNLYFTVNSSTHVGLFFIAVLPTLILCLLCVVALFFASSIKWQMRVILINIFAADICTWLGLTVLYLGFPLRASVQMGGEWSCNVAISLFIVGQQQKFAITALYAVMVYVFVKYGPCKLKWYAIVPYIGITWMVAIAISIFPITNESSLNNNGFCKTKGHVPSSLGFVVTVLFVVGENLVLLIATIVFSLLTYCFLKKSALQEDVEMKKAVAKILLYFVIAIIITILSNSIPAAFPTIREAFRDKGAANLISLIEFVVELFLNLPLLITPVATIVILKPIQEELKKMCRKKSHVNLSNEAELESVN